MDQRSIRSLWLLLVLVAGCRSTATDHPRTPPTTLPPTTLPGLSRMDVSATIRAPKFEVNGTFQAQVRSEAISARPLRSRYRGEMALMLTQAGKTLVDLNTVVEGEFDGSPTSGIVEVFARFLDTISATTGPTDLLREPEKSP